MIDNNIAISLKGVTKTYAGQENPALNNISLDIYSGEIIGIIGHSGAGKSTLVRTINGLEDPDSGTVTIGQYQLTGAKEKTKRHYRREIGMIFQQFHLFSSRTVRGNVAYPLTLAKWDKENKKQRVDKLLHYVGLSDYANKYIEQLSGGQKQRVGIARALARSPKVLLADEATSALDPQTTREILYLLKKINTDLGLTIVVITHHMPVVKEICDRVAIMSAGNIVELADTYNFFSTTTSDIVQSFLPTLSSIDSQELIIGINEHPDWLETLHEIQKLGIFCEIKEAKIDDIKGRKYGQIRIYIQGNTDEKDRVKKAFDTAKNSRG